jgi:DHA2 family methylenomycin A resistance protein-like MFS transporter
MTPPPLPAPPKNRAALIAISVGYFMVILDTTVVNVALGNIQTDLTASVSGLQWVVDAYALVFASLLLATGALGDRLGNRRVFIAGLIAFVGASLLCGAAPTLPLLIAARLLQGAGAALLVPASLSILRHAFTDTRQRAKAVAAWASVGSVALAAGPLMGGFLVASFGWRSIFWLNIPAGAIAVYSAWKGIQDDCTDASPGFNFPAQAAGITALAAFTYAIIEGPRHGWTSPLILVMFALTALALVIFALVEFTNTHPVIPRHLWSHRPFVSATLIGFITNYAYYGLVFLLALYFQKGRHLSPLLVGLSFLPMTITTFCGNLLSGRLNAAYGARVPMLIGPLLSLAGLAALPFAGTASALALSALLLLIGTGAGLTIPAMTAVVLESVPKQAAGTAAGILNTARQSGGVVGVALFGAAYASSHQFPTAFQTVALTAGLGTLAGWLLALAFIPHRTPGTHPENEPQPEWALME